MTTPTNKTTHATINEEVRTIFRGWSSDTVKVDLAKTKRADTLRAKGWTSAHCISPKSEGSAATDESWAFAKAEINAGFPKAAQALMEMSAKAAGDKSVNGQPRAYWIRQANSVLGDIRKQLKHREDVAAGKGPQTPKAVADKIREGFDDLIKSIQKADDLACSIDLDDLIKGLGKLKKTIG